MRPPIRSMANPGQLSYQLRPLHRRDRSAIRRICAATAWLGEPAPERIGDEWIWAEFWTRWFTDRERGCSWVVNSSGRVVGYLTGAMDVRRVDGYAPQLAPGIIWRVIRKRLMRRPGSRQALLRLAGAMFSGELALPAGVARRFPATFHFNLLPEARGQGLGSRLMRTFIDRAWSLGAAGIHATLLSVNPVVGPMLAREGFRQVDSRPIRVFAHVDDKPMSIQTWVLPRPGCGG